MPCPGGRSELSKIFFLFLFFLIPSLCLLIHLEEFSFPLKIFLSHLPPQKKQKRTKSNKKEHFRTSNSYIFEHFRTFLGVGKSELRCLKSPPRNPTHQMFENVRFCSKMFDFVTRLCSKMFDFVTPPSTMPPHKEGGDALFTSLKSPPTKCSILFENVRPTTMPSLCPSIGQECAFLYAFVRFWSTPSASTLASPLPENVRFYANLFSASLCAL